MLRKVTLPDGRQVRNIDIVIAKVEAALVSKVAAAKFIIVIAGTSSGKTITIPSALWSIRPRIIVTMPTIVLVKETAADICKYVPGFVLGQNVGMQSSSFRIRAIRGITFATDGILLAHLTTLPDETIMNMYSIIIIDEFHTRSVVIDFVVFILRAFVDRNYANPLCPVIICMSATIDPTRYVAYFGMLPESVIEIPGAPTFNKDLVFLQTQTPDYIRSVCDAVHTLHGAATDTNILVFLPTAASIQKVSLACADIGRNIVTVTGMATKNGTVNLAGDNKLFLATPVAEVGLTISNLSHVIDSGLHLAVEYNPVHDCTIVLLKPVTRASAIQRIGRVGRKMSGEAHLMYTRETFDTLIPYAEPTIVYTEFTNTLLLMMASDILKTFWENPLEGIKNYWKFYSKQFMLEYIDLIDNPATDSMRCAMAKLYLMGMYSPYSGLTRLGALASGIIGISVSGIRAIFAAYYYKAAMFDIVTIIAGIESGVSAKSFAEYTDDCIAYIAMFGAILKCVSVDDYIAYIAKHKLSRPVIEAWIDLRDSVLYTLVKLGFVLQRHTPLQQLRKQFPDEYASSVAALRMAMYEGYKQNLIHNATCVRNGHTVIYKGAVKIPANAYVVTPAITICNPTKTDNSPYVATYSQVCILPADFVPDTTFCDS